MSNPNSTTYLAQNQMIPPTTGGFFVSGENSPLGNTVIYEQISESVKFDHSQSPAEHLGGGYGGGLPPPLAGESCKSSKSDQSDSDQSDSVKTLVYPSENLAESIEFVKKTLVSDIQTATYEPTCDIDSEQVLTYIKEKQSRRSRYDLQHRVVGLTQGITRIKFKEVGNEIIACVDEKGNPIKVPVFDVCTCGRIHKKKVYNSDRLSEMKEKRKEANEILMSKSDISLDMEEDFTGTMLMYNTETHNVLQRDMHRCAKVWQCPVCTARIAKYRQLKIEKAINTDKWGTMIMMTFTTSHHVNDDLIKVQKGIGERYEKFMRDTAFRNKLKNLGFLEKVTTKEVTITVANGWHPHYHVLMFFENCLSEEQLKHLEDYVKREWIRYCKGINKKGKPLKTAYTHKIGIPSYEHGADITYVVRPKNLSKDDKEYESTQKQIGKLAGYIQSVMGGGVDSQDTIEMCKNSTSIFSNLKADPSYELTHWHKKNPLKKVINFNSVKGFSPFQLAVIATTEEVSEKRRKWAKRRFLEYLDAYFGVQQVHFSRGFNETFGIEGSDKSDEEIANSTQKSSVELFYIEEKLFNFIKSQKFGEPRLYELAERSVQLNTDDVKDFVCESLAKYIEKYGSDSDIMAYMQYVEKKVVYRNLREYVEKQDSVIKEINECTEPIDWGKTQAIQKVLSKLEEVNGGGMFDFDPYKPLVKDKGKNLVLNRDKQTYTFYNSELFMMSYLQSEAVRKFKIKRHDAFVSKKVINAHLWFAHLWYPIPIDTPVEESAMPIQRE